MKNIDKRISLTKFFDILGQIEIVLHKDIALKYITSVYTFENVSGTGVVLKRLEKLPMCFGSFAAGDDFKPWIYTKFIGIDNFTSFDTYISAKLSMAFTLMERSSRFLVCPKSTMWQVRNPDPVALGYPVDLILQSNTRAYANVEAILRNIDLREVDNFLVTATVCGDQDELSISQALLNYSRMEMPMIRDVCQRIVNLTSQNEQSIITLPFASAAQHLQPSFGIFYSNLMFERLPLYVRMAYELTIKATAPVLVMEPINDSTLMKQAQGSATRSGFLPDVISVQYTPDMAADFTVLLSTLLCPGYLQVDVDWSDCPNYSVDLQGFIALICKAFFMYSEGRLSSLTDDGVRSIENRIVASGVKAQLLVRNPIVDQNTFPLQNVAVHARNLPGAVLESLRTDGNGGGWMNGNRQIFGEDGADGLYVLPAERRPVYAVNCSDYHEFLNDENRFMGEWRIYGAIEQYAFAWSRKNSSLSEIMTLYLNNALRILVHMNEYLRCNWQTGLRLPAGISDRLVGNERVEQWRPNRG